ncbi:hypothetical protein GQ43DRAFT_136676 [Delitschia confertaspora ATCC 74209]|uniref:Uncharacterized protein n=1 Tax=Delitschia confertaspora ATCC 74209 TaxID=1513339 RepID=A0A9P4JUP5_9PLEO|nr:hypothetical protein GQ43DRAFT_136676 [Delitschia confertaspora ATCC 74209]
MVSRLKPTHPNDALPGALYSPGHVYLLLDIPPSRMTYSNDTCGPVQMHIPTAQSGPWQSFTVRTGPWQSVGYNQSHSNTERLRVSVCYDAVDQLERQDIPHDFNVSISLEKELRREPEVSVNGIHSMDTYDIRRQLGAIRDAAKLSSVGRGVIPFDIKSVDEQRNYIGLDNSPDSKDYDYTKDMYNTTTTPFMWDQIWSAFPTNILEVSYTGLRFILSWNATSIVEGESDIHTPSINFFLKNVFLNTLANTQNPALTLQALWAIVLRNVYYDTVPFFDYKQQAMIRLISEAQMPRDHNGLVAVTALVARQWIITMFIVALFVMRSKHLVLHKALGCGVGRIDSGDRDIYKR